MSLPALPSTDEVLAWVNRVRDEHGLGEPLSELPEGKKGNGSKCPVALAIGAEHVIATSDCVSWGDPMINGDHHEITPPEFVGTFMHEFDFGRYPDLVR